MSKNISFNGKVFFSLIPCNIAGTVSALLYTINFINFSNKQIRFILAFALLIYSLFQFFIAPIIHHILASNLSSTLDIYISAPHKMTAAERTELVKTLMAFPLKKAVEIEISFIAGNFLIAFAFYLILELPLYSALTLFCVSSLAAYVAFIYALENTQKLCNIEAEKICAIGIDNDEAEKTHFFGLSLLKKFILYVIVPIIICSFFTYLSTIINYSIVNTISISVMNLAITTFATYLFFTRIKNRSKEMEKALIKLNNCHPGSSELFQTDFSSEMSYFAFLINKTILLFRSIINNTIDVNHIINESTVSLSSVATETASASTEQYSTSNEILATMKTLNQNLSEIGTKADEVLKVADNTASQVDKNFNILKQNSEIMKEIKDSNTATINGIQSLSNKISNIQDIVNLINTVTAQTKIIAFNAELEATNIEDSDGNFQNVATDIRSLADSTTELTNNIQKNIDKIKDSNEALIKTGKEFIDKINEGFLMSSQIEDNFYTIQKAASDTALEAKQIQASVPEQLLAFKQIEGALQDINARLNDLNDSTHKISTSIDMLTNESGNIKQLIPDTNRMEEV